MEFRPPVGLLIPGRGLVPGNPAYQPNNTPVGLFSPAVVALGSVRAECSVIAHVRGDSAKILVGCLGFLVSRPGIGEMSAPRWGPPRFRGKFRGGVLSNRLQKTDGEQIFMMPYNPGLVSLTGVLFIVRAKKETVYFLDPLPGNRVVDEEAKNILNSAIKIYNSHIGRQGRKATIWKTLPGTPKQPSSVECGYYVMRFMRDIIMDPSLEFEKTFAKGKDQAPYPQAAIDEVRKEWAEFVCLHME
ncbi:unnamed protein product [Prunus armeniaca]